MSTFAGALAASRFKADGGADRGRSIRVLRSLSAARTLTMNLYLNYVKINKHGKL
jgi:hypothetical protein